MRTHAQHECLQEKREKVDMGHTVKVDVVELELLKRLVELLLDELGLVRRVPELGGDEEFLALHDGRNDLLQCTPNLPFATTTSSSDRESQDED